MKQAQIDIAGLSPADETLDELALLAQLFYRVVSLEYNVLSLKTYRLAIPPVTNIPITPCLDHEAQLHEHDAPHIACYVQDRESGTIATIVYLPSNKTFVVEEETADASAVLESIATFLRQRYRNHKVNIHKPRPGSAYVRARAVAEAHVPLELVLVGGHDKELKPHLERLNGISVLMEKASRVSSWGIRTAYAPLTAAAVFILVLVIPSSGGSIFELTHLEWVRIALLSAIGTAFLYYGLKAVQLTNTATRLAKRIREYEFIMACRTMEMGSDATLLPPPPVDSPARLRCCDELADLVASDDGMESVSALISAWVATTDWLFDKRGCEYSPSFLGVCALRLAHAERQQQGLIKELNELYDDPCDRAIVSHRKRLADLIAHLDAKCTRFKGIIK